MFLANDLPELGANLVPALSTLNMKDLSHFSCTSKAFAVKVFRNKIVMQSKEQEPNKNRCNFIYIKRKNRTDLAFQQFQFKKKPDRSML
uniref:Tubulin beta-5 chain n=1 Tax=Rhizophora mucronata TaxID=61149 RepID=A0A2P2KXJ0_RHIMU